MVLQLRSWMGKRNDRGYTLVSVLVVLISLSLFSIFSVAHFQRTYERYSLRTTMDLCRELLIQAKYSSYLEKSSQKVCFYEDHASYNESELYYLNGIQASEICFTYTDTGNVTKAGTLLLHSKNYQMKMTIQIGGGYFEVWEIEDS